MGAEDYLRGMLSAYYRSVQVDSVPDIAMREFGIGEFGKKISSRHLSFRSAGELNSFLREKAPFYISYSNALYDFPAARPMEAKKLVGADLVYEFDADDLKTDCKKSHDSWRCPQCKASGKGNMRDCPECGSGTGVDEWVCPECLGAVRSQTKKLISVLENDFGLSSGLSINFSGSKGYHIHIRGGHVRQLSKSARIEMLDYITGTNLDLDSLGFGFSEKAYFCPKYGSAKGWAKKILGRVRRALEEGDAQKISVMGHPGLPKTKSVEASERLLKERQAIFLGMERGLLLGVRGVKLKEFWDSVLSFAADEERLAVDRQTSIDINKIVRVPGTIHGSTGLLAKEVQLSGLDSFDPFSDSVVLPSDEVKVSGAVSPKFFLAGKWLGPFSGEDAVLPAYAAYYLLARGAARGVA